MNWLTLPRWSPYAAGIGIGILSWLTFLLSDKTIGCSTAFSRIGGMLERWLRGKKMPDRPYFRKFTPTVTWDTMLVLGVLIGALASALLSGSFELTWVPGVWEATFGNTPVARVIVTFIGGILMGVGSRWAGGCTSGHGISGTLQLTVSGWLAAICFFAGGIATAMLMFRLGTG